MRRILLSTITTATLLVFSLLITSSAQATETPVAKPLSSDNGYSTVLRLKTPNYGEQSVMEFNATVQAAIENDEGFLSTYNDANAAVSSDDENYSFISLTLRHSVSEVIMPQLDEPVSFPGSAMKEDMHTEADDVGEDFIFTAMYEVAYDILDPAQMTIAERDQLLESVPREIQALISGMSNNELQADGVKAKLQTAFDELAQRLSTQKLVFRSIGIQAVEVHEAGRESTL